MKWDWNREINALGSFLLGCVILVAVIAAFPWSIVALVALEGRKP